MPEREDIPLLMPEDFVILWRLRQSESVKKESFLFDLQSFLPRLVRYKLITESNDLLGASILAITPLGESTYKEQLERTRP